MFVSEAVHNKPLDTNSLVTYIKRYCRDYVVTCIDEDEERPDVPLNTISIPENCKMVIFDFDETLHCRNKDYFDERIRDILEFLRSKNVKLAIASLSTVVITALRSHSIIDFFDIIEYRRGIQMTKIGMLQKIIEQSELDVSEVIFYDNIMSYCMEAHMLGIKSVHVYTQRGIRNSDIKYGMEMFEMEDYELIRRN